MKKTLKTGKKALSVFMAVLMALTSWVFFAPEKAEAATAGQYYYKVTFQVTNTMDNVQMLSTLYGRTNNGTGPEVAIASKNYTSDKDFSGTMTFVEGWTERGVFPTRFHIGDNNGAKYYLDRDLEGYWHVYVGPNATTLTEVYLNGVKHSSEAENMSVGSGKGAKWYWQVRNHWFTGKVNRFNIDYNIDSSYYPYINSLTDISGASNITMPKTGAANKKETYTSTARDQYGVNWYADPTFYIKKSDPADGDAAKDSDSLTGLSMSGGTLTVTPSAQIEGEESTKYIWVTCVVSKTLFKKKKVQLTDPQYEIIFKQEGVTGDLLKQNYSYGTTPIAPKNYTLPKMTAEGHYVFDGWNPTVGPAKKDQTYYVKFKLVNHIWETYSKTDSNCAQEGVEKQKCRDCEATREVPVEKKQHTWVKGDVHAAKCTTDGWTDYRCQKCQATKEDDKVTALGHDISVASRREATCKNTGIINYKCSRCTYTYSETIPVVSHSYTRETVTKYPTCEGIGHAYYQCEWCNNYDPSRNGRDGVDLPALGHDWDEWYVETPAGCETTGVEKRVCKRDAAHVEKRDIPQTGHDFKGATVQTKEATCTEDGYTYQECTHDNCTEIKELDTIPKLNHNDGGTGEWVVTKKVTCEVDGLKQYECGLCKVYVKSETIGKIGHSFKNYVKSKDATCTENAKETATCDHGCGKTDTREIAGTKLGHEWGEYKYDNNAKCEENGTETASCKREGCKATNTKEAEGTALKHQFTKYKITKLATCLDNAQETAECDHGCKKTDTRERANTALGHTCSNFAHNEGTQTCCELGTKTGTCVRCGVEYTVKEDRPEYYAPHTYETDKDGNIVYHFVEGSANCEHDGKERAYCQNAEAHRDDGKNWKCETYLERTAEGTKLPHSFPDPEKERDQYTSNNDGTCLKDGTMYALCTMCNKAKQTVTEPNSRKPHFVANWISDNNATCTEDGTKHGECVYGCGKKFENEPDVGSALGHWFRDYKESKAATCTGDRERTATCERKDCTATETVTDKNTALGHDWSDWKFVGEAADCTKGGTMERHCKRACCIDENGDPTVTDTKEVGATEHTWTWEIIEEKAEDGSDLPADCTRGYKKHQVCSVCEEVREGSEVEVPGGAHHLVVLVDEKATCTEDGKRQIGCDLCDYKEEATVIPKTDHINTVLDESTVVAATCKEKGYSGDIICALCKAVVEKGHETDVTTDHVFTKYTTVTQATCTNNATEKAFCDVCGKAENTREIPGSALGHSFTKFVAVENSATCTKDGTKTAHCDREGCEATKEMRDVGTALGHKWGEWVTVIEPTCTDTGKAKRSCEREGCGLEVEKQLRKLSHTPGEWIIDKEATCTEEGSRHKECVGGCGYKFEEEVIPKLEHKFVVEIHGVTCIDDGYSTYTCSECGTTKQGEIVKALGHDWSGEWVVTKAPTCTKKGSETLTCTRCDKTQTRTIDALGHNEVIDPAVPATCDKPGLSEGSHCDRCGEVLKEQETVTKPHRDADGDGKCDECGKEIKHSTDLGCGCICHKEFWLMKLLYKVLLVFWKLFRIGKGCSCGAVHY